MRSAALTNARRDDRPPVSVGVAPSQGVADPVSPELRPTVRMRSLIQPALDSQKRGFPPDHPYVRRFWTAALGPGAVTDLLRMIAAAHQGREVPRPLNLPSLARAGLVRSAAGVVLVTPLIPPLPRMLVDRLPPSLRAEHKAWQVS